MSKKAFGPKCIASYRLWLDNARDHVQKSTKNKVLYERHGSHIGSVTKSNQSNIKMKSKPNKQLLTVML